ncbi:transposase [Ereboglobus luteus]|uniref:Transposase IS4-like domain-containing protein n=1 Tax=Ereboglobus luteus TaxID=1796921 RepID=A0A2U8E2U0_9BACT|nr:transposase [Ereboglobus luteus]AWI09105.1 hypothetical protein CKA38_07520 [Ereboglobus luteus]
MVSQKMRFPSRFATNRSPTRILMHKSIINKTQPGPLPPPFFPHIRLCTTLTDEAAYCDRAIIELYLRRWRIELFFRDIKISLGLDVARCLTPGMVEKEIWMQAIAHNTVRALMLEAAKTHGADVERLGFMGAVDAMRAWAEWLNRADVRQNKRLLLEMLLAIASDQVPFRLGRSEPCAKKRRPKSHQLLTNPRHEMVLSKSRRNK